MKYIKYVLIGLLHLAILTIGLSQSNQLILHSVDKVKMAVLQQASEIIEARLEKSKVEILSIQIAEDVLILHLSPNAGISQDNLDLLLTTKGNLEFRETLDRSEFFHAISNSDPIMQYVDRDLVTETPASKEYNALIAEIDESDLKNVRYQLDRLEKQANFQEMEVMFGFKNEQGRTPLYSLAKKQDKKLNRGDLAKIDLLSSPGDQKLSLVFSDQGAKAWAEMTKKQIGKMIAIVLDDVVFMTPKVQAEITRGRAQISGLWGDGGDWVLYSILETEMLPTTFEFQIR